MLTQPLRVVGFRSKCAYGLTRVFRPCDHPIKSGNVRVDPAPQALQTREGRFHSFGFGHNLGEALKSDKIAPDVLRRLALAIRAQQQAHFAFLALSKQEIRGARLRPVAL